MLITDCLRELGFQCTLYFVDGSKIDRMFLYDDRCGIYVLHFSDGAFYAGQAIDVVKRCKQHLKMYNDVVALSFMCVDRDNLDEVEKSSISLLEKSFVLRNISLMSDPKGARDFGGLFPIDDQESWLLNGGVLKYTQRIENSLQRYKYARRFSKLMEDKWVVDEVLPVFKKYVQTCIPEPFLTELSYWGCSCLPGGGERGYKVLSRVNIYWQEVFTVAIKQKIDEFLFSWHIARSVFDGTYSKIYKKYAHVRTLWCDDHFYRTGGTDQFNVTVLSNADALSLLDDNTFVQACKTFNLRNMRKGCLTYASSHCMDLADLLLEGAVPPA